jgi:hypothetical protein
MIASLAQPCFSVFQRQRCNASGTIVRGWLRAASPLSYSDPGGYEKWVIGGSWWGWWPSRVQQKGESARTVTYLCGLVASSCGSA